MPCKSRILLCCVLLLCFSIKGSKSLAQCTSSIPAPYFQDFEADNGGWFTGGTSSDWAWGTPAKTVIDRAFSGSKCWITGGLAKSSYNNNENAYIQSPCFDLSSLTDPFLSVKVFWETENGFDGANMQYSIDSGKTFVNLGTYNDGQVCPADNWFKTMSIRYLSSNIKEGWSGNIQQQQAGCQGGLGGGLGKWVSAKHNLSFLKGHTHVVFRFLFGAGSTCNNFDGFAIDDFSLNEAPTNTASFTYSCSGSKAVQFNAADVICPATYLWNFGDPSSGANNTSTLQLPVHNYASAGSYNVTLQIIKSNTVVASLQQTVQVIDVVTGPIALIDCFGDKNGSVNASVLGPANTYAYSWNTVPVQTTPTAKNLAAGTYQVTVTAPNTCATVASVTLTEPPALTHTISQINPLCSANGSITVNASGGTPNYDFNWNPNVSNTSMATSLAAGSYIIAINDGNSCTDTARVTLVNQPNTLTINLGNDTTICPGFTVVLKPGAFKTYTWQDQSTAATYTATQTGDYSVTVTDNNGCTASDKIHVTVDCSDVFFPSAFTPNGDKKNETFGPIGNVPAMLNYTFKVFNRYGQAVFETSNPYKKWNGTVNGNIVAGVYVWYADYFLLGSSKQFAQKGIVYLMQ